MSYQQPTGFYPPPQASPYGGGGGGRGYHNHHHRRGGGGGGGGYRDNGYNSMQSQQQREENKARQIRSTLFKLGDDKDFHPPSDLLKLARWVQDRARDSVDPITAAFRVMVTEQPHKTPLIAALIGFMCLSPHQQDKDKDKDQDQQPKQEDDQDQLPTAEPTSEADTVGITVVKGLVKAFTTYLDARLWRNIRLSLHLFAALVPLEIISADSFRTLLLAFAAVLEEPGVSASRGDRAATCIIESLCRGGQDLLDGREQLDELVDKIIAYSASRKVEVELASPFKGEAPPDPFREEAFEHSIQAVEQLRAQGYRRPAFLPSPVDLLPPAISASASSLSLERRSVTLPEVLVPPDEEDEAGMDVAFAQLGERARPHRKVDTGKGDADQRRSDAGPERISRQARWFPDSVPVPGTPCSVVLRTMLADMIDLYEINRKEAARLVLDLPHWLRRGTFGGKVSPDEGLCGEAEDEWWVVRLSSDEAEEGEGEENKSIEGAWSLDDFVVETILSAALTLPVPPRNVLYYTALLREVVSITPGTIAPSLGRTIRTFYSAMATGDLDVEVIHRFADWFSIHLSNFNFGWAWKEWIGDVELPESHARRSFARRVVELEVRLAYYDRIKQTLPAEIQASSLAPEEPGPTFTYEDPSHPFHEQAMRLINSIKAKAAAEVIMADFESFKSAQGASESDVRDLAMQAILSVGSRSFSHFLNIVERYHSLLRTLSGSAAMRLALLRGAARFWSRAPQWLLIVSDKLLQYRIVEPADVVDFIFSHFSADGWADGNAWTLLRLTLNKVNGRVDQLHRRLEAIERDEEARAAAAANEDDGSPLPAKKEEEQPLFPTGLPVRPVAVEEKKTSAEEAREALAAIQAEQRKVLVKAVTGLVALVPPRNDATPATQDEWNAWWIRGWYAECVRLFNKQIMANRETILANAFATDTQGEAREILERAIDMLSE